MPLNYLTMVQPTDAIVHRKGQNLRASRKNGLKPSYDGFCRDMGIEDINSVIRIKSPEKGNYSK